MTIDYGEAVKQRHLKGIKNSFMFGVVLGTMLGVTVTIAMIEMFLK